MTGEDAVDDGDEVDRSADEQPRSDLPVVRQWPPNEPLDPETAIAARCSGCGAPWRVHPDMAGFKLRCSCGVYVQVPKREVADPRAFQVFDDGGDARLPTPKVTRDDQGRLEIPVKAGETSARQMPVAAAMAPGTVQHGTVETKQKWTNAAILELALMMCAFLLPQLAISLSLEGEAQALAMPFASLVTGVAVVLIAALSSPYAFTGFRRAHLVYFIEAVAVAAIVYLLAMGYGELIEELFELEDGEAGSMYAQLRDRLGYGWFLFVLAFTPAVFEEIAFRGAVQGRFCALLGRYIGIVVTGAAFGLAHGVTLALPFHVGIGFYLCFLRERSKSLLPCMLMHFVYNGAIGVTV